MRTKTLLIITLIIGVLFFSVHYNAQKKIVLTKIKLTDEQMALIKGKGCSFWAWLAAVAADVGCAVAPDPWACLAAAGTSADCISQLLDSNSSGGANGGCIGNCGGGPGSIGPNGKPLPITQ